MKKFVSIRAKLVTSTMVLITSIFILVISLVTTMNKISVGQTIAKSKEAIWNALLTKGKMMSLNNSVSMTGMAEDNAFTAIQSLLSSTVKDDEDIIYGIYMTKENIPWIYATSENPDGIVSAPEPLDDSMSTWASNQDTVSYRSFDKDGMEIIEFASPLFSEEQKLGTMRYGLSIERMNRMRSEFLAGSNAARNLAILILLLLYVVSLLSSYVIIHRITEKI